ncbi:UNVERIFIED_CONTAM: hypothetical protein HDU68_006925, partial [Siphonaria sp. JEL0065]
MSTANISTAILPAFSNPFTLNGERVLGKPWVLPSIPQLPAGIQDPGYGCFQDPLEPRGYPLFNSSESASLTLEKACLPGFFCPYLDITNPATYPVECPPSGK